MMENGNLRACAEGGQALSRPRGNYHYLILRESVWLCFHLAEAGWMLCLMLSLLLSTTAGDEEPFITTSILEGVKKREDEGRHDPLACQ